MSCRFTDTTYGSSAAHCTGGPTSFIIAAITTRRRSANGSNVGHRHRTARSLPGSRGLNRHSGGHGGGDAGSANSGRRSRRTPARSRGRINNTLELGDRHNSSRARRAHRRRRSGALGGRRDGAHAAMRRAARDGGLRRCLKSRSGDWSSHFKRYSSSGNDVARHRRARPVNARQHRDGGSCWCAGRAGAAAASGGHAVSCWCVGRAGAAAASGGHAVRQGRHQSRGPADDGGRRPRTGGQEEAVRGAKHRVSRARRPREVVTRGL